MQDIYLFCWLCPRRESPKPGRYLCPAAGSPETATTEGLTGPCSSLHSPAPLPSVSRGENPPPPTWPPAPPPLPARQHLPSQQRRAWWGSAAPSRHKSCTIPSSRLTQYPGLIFHPFPCFLAHLLDSLQPLPGAPKRGSFEERPRPRHPRPRAPCSLARGQSVEQPAQPLHKSSWMKKSLAI